MTDIENERLHVNRDKYKSSIHFIYNKLDYIYDYMGNQINNEQLQPKKEK
jgi:hypothetical protein